MNYRFTCIVFFICFYAFAQETDSNYKTKTVAVTDSIRIDSVSINSSFFSLKKLDASFIDESYYEVDFAKAILKLKKPIDADSIVINYLAYPEFLTKTYRQLDDKIILANTNNQQLLYKFSQSSEQSNFMPFDGLTTTGSISRGVVIGNNQNSVLNSELDLQITGKLNDKVSLRASIQDSNVPLQEAGYSQRLDEFDQVFIELFSDNWKIRAGDVDLENTDSYFGNFTKRVQGLAVNAKLNHDAASTNLFAAGALVRGQYTTSQFTAQEGNQGPYKLKGSNAELYVLIVSGSETVYVNGIALERGENKDYIINYNAGEIIFNSTFPITSEMRITVDYQFSERNYSRLVVFGGAKYDSEKFKIGVSIYSENDSKNSPLQQNLSEDQVEILANAGDDKSLMVAPSSSPEAYNENRILYKKELINGIEAFVFSNNPEDELYSARFMPVGFNQGNYIISDEFNGEQINAISTIFKYIEPIAGEPQGNYEPIIQLVAPTKLQMAIVNGSYAPTEQTNIDFEVAGSKNDLNLFSNIDNENNDGFAGKIKVDQAIIKKDSLWNINAMIDTDFVQEDFRSVQRIYNAEFNRDWNLDQPTMANQTVVPQLGNQLFFKTGLRTFHPEKGLASYQFEHLNYSENFNGNRHVTFADLHLNKWHILSNSSFLTANSINSTSNFIRSYNRITYSLNKAWVGTRLALEDNEQKDKITKEYTALSQRYKSYEVFTGIGDSTKVFAEIGYKHRVNDSVRDGNLQKVNTSNTFYIDSRIIKNTKTNLSIYANYRTLKDTGKNTENENSLNSRIIFSQRFFDQLVFWNTVFETNSGTLPQQEFTYIEVESGQGVYTWIDYNSNGIQELEEFEISQFPDEADYIRVLLPNQVFIKTHQNRLSQLLTLNPQQWINSKNSFKKLLSRFHNQTSYLVDRREKRSGNNFNLNPFEGSEVDQLALQLNFRNVLFFNRGKQHYTTSYTYLSNSSQNTLSFGFIENNLQSHKLQFTHKFATSWLANLESSFNNNISISENYASKNFDIDESNINPKISYLLNDNTRFDIFYQYTSKENTISNFETLKQQKYGAAFTFANFQQSAISGEFNYFKNDFAGSANTAVAYQMMEGLQPGKNFTWSVLAQKKLTSFLDLNLTYYGRKSETSTIIHTGNVQLKAYF
ncbi:hypothetical protein BZARG_495 [Bizionia argentinensis JUB59]|uniref:DUF2460 domain-containing protein n=1 Tax=Bizionia argentinensis JUB59 TaxID=1046627 RepID=G2EHA8_9FLAO|nr:hypothetical protein [Bizionia argentinensis]EGV42109.1 hypothetical protein BZARG_495 [Bizionia argentinensis JUB59]